MGVSIAIPNYAFYCQMLFEIGNIIELVVFCE